ncbi:MAG: PucR family transcriptional regulator, partial [Proteobacteria bacterium]
MRARSRCAVWMSGTTEKASCAAISWPSLPWNLPLVSSVWMPVLPSPSIVTEVRPPSVLSDQSMTLPQLVFAKYTFEPAARSLLAPLGEPGGELIRTLGAYFDAGTSLVETAAVLGVHRNTVSARIARVESALQVDLTDPDQRLALHLACRALPH